MTPVPEARSITLCSSKPLAPPFHRHIVKGKLMHSTCQAGDHAVIYDIVATEPAGPVRVTSATHFNFEPPSEPAESPIIAENISLLYDNGRGVRDVSLSVHPGQCLGILGANGSGKTTLTRLVAGLDRPQSGRLSVLGHNAHSRPAKLRQRCGVALDKPSHWDNLSGRQNLWFFARQYGLKAKSLQSRLDELLLASGLADQADELVADYSFGMRRKLSLLEALCHDPDLLILDEPSAGIDVAFLQTLAQWIRTRSRQGKVTWIADNNADWLSRVATHALLLCDGMIGARGPVPELINSVDSRSRIELLLEQPCTSPLLPLDGVSGLQVDGNRLLVEVPDDPAMPSTVLDWIAASGGRVASMAVRSTTLHEALMQRAAQPEAHP